MYNGADGFWNHISYSLGVIYMERDIRWIQRLGGFQKALQNLSEAIELSRKRELSWLEKQGLIQAFEYTYELAWHSAKDFYESRGEGDIHGSRDAFRLAFERGLVERGQALMNAIRSRQLTSHTYNERTAEEIYRAIIDEYYDAFKELADNLEREKLKKV